MQDKDLKKLLRANPDACKVVDRSSEQWHEVQFFEGEALDALLGDCSHHSSRNPEKGLLSKLVDSIFRDPPHELFWMKDNSNAHDIKEAICGKEHIISAIDHLHEDHLSDVLALRGLVAGGLMKHCLLKRHRVNYGVARPGKKKLAVPFRFADTPDKRSEFAHPDCAIAFTILAYYHDGLSKQELMKALKALLKMGENAQRNFYSRWLDISSDQMEKEGTEIAKSLDSVEKIDLTNDVQFERLYSIDSKNMAAIDFYLNNCVFPAETDQFDSR